MMKRRRQAQKLSNQKRPILPVSRLDAVSRAQPTALLAPGSWILAPGSFFSTHGLNQRPQKVLNANHPHGAIPGVDHQCECLRKRCSQPV